MIKYDNRGRVIIHDGQEDPRYMIRLYLVRESRPKYWDFHCIYCGEKVCEVSGTVIYMADISNEGAAIDAFAGTRQRCNSRKCGGRAWFAFEF